MQNRVKICVYAKQKMFPGTVHSLSKLVFYRVKTIKHVTAAFRVKELDDNGLIGIHYKVNGIFGTCQSMLQGGLEARRQKRKITSYVYHTKNVLIKGK